MDNIKKEEVRVKVAKRVPPGDKWRCIYEGADTNNVLDCLTDALETVFQDTGATKFYMDAREGFIYSVDIEEHEIIPEPEKTYSLYGEY